MSHLHVLNGNRHASRILEAMKPELLTTSTAARILAIAPDTVRLWERKGKLHAIRTASGVRLFDRSEIEMLAEQRGTPVGSAA